MNYLPLLLLCAASASALCPFAGSKGHALPAGHPVVDSLEGVAKPVAGYEKALAALDLDAVKADLKHLFLDSKAEWPADYGNYGYVRVVSVCFAARVYAFTTLQAPLFALLACCQKNN